MNLRPKGLKGFDLDCRIDVMHNIQLIQNCQIYSVVKVDSNDASRSYWELHIVAIRCMVLQNHKDIYEITKTPLIEDFRKQEQLK